MGDEHHDDQNEPEDKADLEDDSDDEGEQLVETEEDKKAWEEE